MTMPAAPLPADLSLALADLQDGLSTRTVNEFAAEARLDGESLHQALERYELDYAWYVLGSDRLHQQTLKVLEARLRCAANDAQKASVSAVLRSAAAAQASDRLMSFDNDVAERLADRLSASWAQATA